MSSIEAFRSSINRFTDFAKTSRFWVTISNPPTGGDTELLRYRCTDAELPGRTFATFENRTYGLLQSYPTQTIYGQLNLTFLCSANFSGSTGILPATPLAAEAAKDTGFAEKKIFEDWMDYINPTENAATNITVNALYNFRYKSQYARDITVEHYDLIGAKNGDNIPTYRVKFIECFPISMNQISLNWSNEDNASLIVTFAYKRWQRESTPLNNALSSTDSGQITAPPTQITSTESPFSLQNVNPFEFNIAESLRNLP